MLLPRMLPREEGERIIKSRRSADGLVRRSEEPSGAEALAVSAFVPMRTAGSLRRAGPLSFGAQEMKAFFHLFSLMTALCVSFN